MKRAFKVVSLLTIAITAGLLASEALYRSSAGQQVLVRLAHYLADLGSRAGVSVKGQIFDEAVRAENLQRASINERVADEEVDHELGLLRFQFGDDETFVRLLDASHLSVEALRAELVENLRARRWIEKEIASDLDVAELEIRRFYELHRDRFTQPPRFRASHLFLAAPTGVPQEVVARQQSAIQGLAVRILGGENLTQLVTEASEDEATKSQGGDLGYFSSDRITPEVVAEMEKLRVGEVSAPVRTDLGFHIFQLMETKPSRDPGLQEVEAEITLALANEKRGAAVARLTERLTVRFRSAEALWHEVQDCVRRSFSRVCRSF